MVTNIPAGRSAKKGFLKKTLTKPVARAVTNPSHISKYSLFEILIASESLAIFIAWAAFKI